MQYGDLGKRFFAWIIDSIFISIVVFIYSYILTYIGLWIIVCITTPFFTIFYFSLMEGGNWHATIGKKAMGLYVADASGEGVTYSTAILRNICKIISTLVLFIGYILCFFNNEKQCMHDMLAKTYILEGNAEAVGVGPKLICTKGPLAGMVYLIPETGLQIGRDSVSCQVVIPSNEKNISRIHCFVTYNYISNMFIINDRKSSYGTYLSDGRRVLYSKPAALRSGAKFYLVNPNYMFEVR